MTTSERGADSVRRRNLSRVLALVHEGRGVARSGLTAQTGLNRSTVAALVAELIDLGLLRETDPVPVGRVGRPSPAVQPHPDVVALAINPELDAVTVGVVGLGARVDARVRHAVGHPVTADETVSIVRDVVARLRRGALRGRRLIGAGIAVPGLVRDDGLVRWAPHLDWTDEPLSDAIAAALGVPAFAANDATLGARAEHIFGAGRGLEHLVYLNGGASGIGGGVVAAGRLLVGARGYAGEFGRNRPGLIDERDRRTEQGTLEDEASRAHLLQATGLDDADEQQLADAISSTDDRAVLDEVARQRRVLAVAIGDAVNALDPEALVLGGFLAAILESDPADMHALVRRQVSGPAGERVALRSAALGPERLLIGAAELAFAPLLADPAGA
ncbi:ROK family protein [Schumannella sp. 10F1B-5-1]|uniref:ROK family protein n=1 Tax=Schumannella sp. 10F1B-5-1 TaxID=2590780 RepID=UPI0011305A6B|nr:ROK family protein [Schumannella sp. 10F1B-5-1]TPW78284.1 ROK family protein [Schumannella sp. 10F1B-5-1]